MAAVWSTYLCRGIGEDGLHTSSCINFIHLKEGGKRKGVGEKDGRKKKMVKEKKKWVKNIGKEILRNKYMPKNYNILIHFSEPLELIRYDWI